MDNCHLNRQLNCPNQKLLIRQLKSKRRHNSKKNCIFTFQMENNGYLYVLRWDVHMNGEEEQSRLNNSITLILKINTNHTKSLLQKLQEINLTTVSLLRVVILIHFSLHLLKLRRKGLKMPLKRQYRAFYLNRHLHHLLNFLSKSHKNHQN